MTINAHTQRIAWNLSVACINKDPEAIGAECQALCANLGGAPGDMPYMSATVQVLYLLSLVIQNVPVLTVPSSTAPSTPWTGDPPPTVY